MAPRVGPYSSDPRCCQGSARKLKSDSRNVNQMHIRVRISLIEWDFWKRRQASKIQPQSNPYTS